jgi:uncharacterized protein (DUF58 family)
MSLYIFSLVIMYLAGVYFGTFLFGLFIMFLVLPPLSFAAFLFWIANIRCTQNIDRLTPVKGDLINLTVRIDNRAILPIPHLAIGFTKVSDALRAELSDFTMYLAPRGRHETTYRIACPYRGAYSIGIASLEISDQLGFFTFRKRIEPVRVTVFPRVLDIPRFAPVANDVEGSGRFASGGLLPDTTLFYQLKEYREGDSIRHIYWKKYAATGVPFLKEYDRTKRAGVRIYFDCRPADRWDVNRLEQEDVSVEALVAIVRYLLHRRVHTTVFAGTDPKFSFTGDNLESFERLYRATTRLTFLRGFSPLSLYETDNAAGNLESQTCIFISHIRDPELFLSNKSSEAHDTIYLLNRSGLASHQHEAYEILAQDARRRGNEVVMLRSSSTIFEDLTGHRLAFSSGGSLEPIDGMGIS